MYMYSVSKSINLKIARLLCFYQKGMLGISLNEYLSGELEKKIMYNWFMLHFFSKFSSCNLNLEKVYLFFYFSVSCLLL